MTPGTPLPDQGHAELVEQTGNQYELWTVWTVHCDECGYSGPSQFVVTEDDHGERTTPCPECTEQAAATPNAAANPMSIPQYVQEGLERQDPGTLQEIAAFVLQLADRKRFDAAIDVKRRREEVDDLDVDVDPEAAGVPGNAYVTTKTIDGEEYYYWQWREGPQSWGNQYIRPVDESDE